MNQNKYANNLRTINLLTFTKKEFSHVRGQLVYTANGTRPDIVFNYAQLAHLKATKSMESVLNY